MLQNPRKTLGFKKNMGGGGKPYPASGLYVLPPVVPVAVTTCQYYN